MWKFSVVANFLPLFYNGDGQIDGASLLSCQDGKEANKQSSQEIILRRYCKVTFSIIVGICNIIGAIANVAMLVLNLVLMSR